MTEFLSQPWPWFVGGPLIALTMFLLLYLGREFGVSDTLRTTCAAVGGGKLSEFFKIDWKKGSWNIMFILGALIGGFIANQLIPNPEPVAIAESAQVRMQDYGILQDLQNPDLIPVSIFNFESLFTLKGFLLMIVGGFLIGFGTRWAGGCTSGHAISGLSNLQLPSLIAVIGFFIGGLIMTHLLLPYIMAL